MLCYANFIGKMSFTMILIFVFRRKKWKLKVVQVGDLKKNIYFHIANPFQLL